MAYATIENILSQVSPKAPPDPASFPDFDPQDRKAWAYFIYVYLYHSPDERWSPPWFLPACECKEGKSVTWFERVIVTRSQDADPFNDRYSGDQGKINCLQAADAILEYIERLVRQWHYGWDGKPGSWVMGFIMRSQNTYEGCLARADKARDIAYSKLMQYSGEMLYSFSLPYGNNQTRQYGIQADSGEAYILPKLAILFCKVNVEWKKVFLHPPRDYQRIPYRKSPTEGLYTGYGCGPHGRSTKYARIRNRNRCGT